jgi:tetratricopeptide (TPR) repeat protein
MNLIRLARCFLLAVPISFLLSPGAAAQFKDHDNRPAVVARNYTISERELSIPARARDLLQNGNRRLARNDFAGAATQFQRAVSTFPDYYEAYFLLGIADMKINREEYAQEAFRKSIELSGGRYAQAHFGLGLILCAQQSFGEAAAEVQRGLELDSESWFGYYAQARAFFGLGRVQEAEQSAHELIARKADLAEAYLLLADIHQQEHRIAETLSDLDQYIVLDGDSSSRDRARGIRDRIERTLSEAGSITTPQP